MHSIPKPRFGQVATYAAFSAITCVFAILALLAINPTCAYAISAAPGTHGDDTQGCRSAVVGPPITLDVLDARDKSASDEYLDMLGEIKDELGSADATLPASAGVTGHAQNLSLQAGTLQASEELESIPLLIIVIGFANVPYAQDIDWGARIFEGDRSLSTFYRDMSLGAFTFGPAQESSSYGENNNANSHDAPDDGIVHVTLETRHGAWGEDGDSSDKSMMLAFAEAIRQSSDMVDFARYDADGNGAISQDELALGFVVAGYEAAVVDESDGYPHGKSQYLWSHAASISGIAAGYEWDDVAAPTVDGVTVDAYIAIAEYLGDDVANNIGTLAHELGHYLGLPDLYDTSYSSTGAWRNYNIDLLSLMAGGNYSVDEKDDYSMASLDAWSRAKLGWAQPALSGIEGDQATIASQGAIGDSGGNYNVVKIPTAREAEYYLVENRQFSGWDFGLRYQALEGQDGGLLIWHIDEDVYDAYADDNEVNNADHRPAIMPLFIEERYTKFTMTGVRPLCERAFFDAATWASEYGDDIGQTMPLPLYGEGSDADKRAKRTLPGLSVRFLDDAQPAMRIEVGHAHALDHMAALAPTCTEDGHIEHWQCRTCGQLFADEAGEHALDTAAVTQPATGHTLEHVSAVESTCEDAGAVEHWRCATCDCLFSDEDAASPLSADDIALAALGHDYGAWQPFDDETHMRTCAHDASHTQVASHTWEVADTTPSTSTSEGSVTYRCADCGATKTEPVAKLRYQQSDALTAALGVDGNTADAIAEFAQAHGIPTSTLAITDKTLTGGNTDSDVTGSSYLALGALAKKQAKSSVKLSWPAVAGADGYRVYASPCGKKNKCKLIATLPGSARTYTAKKLKRGTYHKFVIVAYKRFSGVDVTIAASPTIHAATKGGKVGNPKKLEVMRKGSAKNLSSLSLKSGKSAKLQVKTVRTGGTVKKHRAIKFVSTDERVATVSPKGKLTARTAGICKVIAYAQNGVSRSITVKVR